MEHSQKDVSPQPRKMGRALSSLRRVLKNPQYQGHAPRLALVGLCIARDSKKS